MIESLQTEFAIPDSVSFLPGNGELVKAHLAHRSGASAEVYLHGGHVTSYKKAGRELLFVSERSWFLPDRPIRGGIPIAFPQFGGGTLPPHGLARISEWRVVKSDVSDSGDVSLELAFASDERTRSVWPHDFVLSLQVTLREESLSARLACENTGKSQFDFQVVLHTYFSVEDIRKCAVHGLEEVEFIDSTLACARSRELHSNLRFEEETDRIYIRTPDSVQINDEGSGRRVSIDKREMPDVVVWNPWVEKSKRMPDFADDEYQRMVCVETGVIAKSIALSPGRKWSGETTFTESEL